jgi:hypothetical protein
MELFGKTAISYINTVLSTEEVRGPKVLLLDRDMRRILDVTYSQSTLLEHEVFLVEPLVPSYYEDAPPRVEMRYMSCVIFARPSNASVDAIVSELGTPRFGAYYLAFSNYLDPDAGTRIARADGQRRVVRVDEVYLDAFPVADEVFRVPLLEGAARPGLPMCPMALAQWRESDIDRTATALVATVLAAKRRAQIRYRAGSAICQKLAQQVAARINMSGAYRAFFDLPGRESTVLLILDRADDPVTPLLTQWTYEAMVHETLGIDGGIVDTQQQDASEQDRRVVLAPQFDAFFAEHRNRNWGDVCKGAKELVDTYLKVSKRPDLQASSLADIKRIVEQLPEMKKQGAMVYRHSTLVGILSDSIRRRSILDLSLLEQELVTSTMTTVDFAAHAQPFINAISPASHYTDDDALRLAVLFEIRHEGKNPAVTGQIRQALINRRLPDAKVELLDRIIAYAGQSRRVGQLFAGATQVLRNAVKAITGMFGTESVANVLTQHVPLLQSQLLMAVTGEMPMETFPLHPIKELPAPADGAAFKAKEVIAFIAGGATYEEALLCNRINAATLSAASPVAAAAEKARESEANLPPLPPQLVGVTVQLGCNEMLNSAMFLRSLP